MPHTIVFQRMWATDTYQALPNLNQCNLPIPCQHFQRARPGLTSSNNWAAFSGILYFYAVTARFGSLQRSQHFFFFWVCPPWSRVTTSYRAPQRRASASTYHACTSASILSHLIASLVTSHELEPRMPANNAITCPPTDMSQYMRFFAYYMIIVHI